MVHTELRHQRVLLLNVFGPAEQVLQRNNPVGIVKLPTPYRVVDQLDSPHANRALRAALSELV